MQWKNPDGSITEGVVIEDGDGTAIAYVYFEDDQNRRSLTKRLSRYNAEEAAKVMAAALRKCIDAER